MTNPVSEMFGNAKEILIGTLFVIVVLIILGALATMPGTPPEAKAAAEQTQTSISWLWVFYLGLPAVVIIIAIIVWIKKNIPERNFNI